MANKKESTYTVKDLIKQLRKIIKEHPEAANVRVHMEGCDCMGTWAGPVGFYSDRVELPR